MAKFYYNGVLLPEIPQDVLTLNPHCWIRNNVDSGYYDLIFSKLRPWFHSGHWSMDYGTETGECVWYKIPIENSDSYSEWVYDSTQTTHFGLTTPRTILWSNIDIPLDSPDSTEIYFKGTKLIPEIEQTYEIRQSTLVAFGDQARRIGSTTELLTTAQMLEIFGNAKVNGTLDGLANGYDVMFYDENNEGLAFYSIKEGQAINPPMYSVANWIDQDGVAIVFPYTPTKDISLWADNSTLSALLYDHFAVSPEEYPYIIIVCRKDATNDSLLCFAQTLTFYLATNTPKYDGVIGVGFKNNMFSSTIEEIVEYLTANFTADDVVSSGLTYQNLAEYYMNHVNHSLSESTFTNWKQFE